MCGEPSKYCPEGSVRPIIVTNGYYSTGGNVSTRTGQAIAPRGYYALSGIIYKCQSGYFGAIKGLSVPTCSGPCTIPGYYCPGLIFHPNVLILSCYLEGSVSPVAHVCGGDDKVCPAGTAFPLPVPFGHYTSDYLYDLCPPGQFRNVSFEVDATLGSTSLIATSVYLPLCTLCPEGTYKAVAGDEFALCRPCDDKYGVSTEDRIICMCETVMEYPDNHYIHFNTVSGTCDIIPIVNLNNVNESLVLYDTSQIDFPEKRPIDIWTANISLTRYQYFACEPGHYCLNGTRFRCPRSRYGGLPWETRPLCQGLCFKGYYCPEASTSPFSIPCGAPNLICPEGSAQPELVPPKYYSNEDTSEILRYEMFPCPLGHYCPGDGFKYSCPAGAYADTAGVTAEICLLCEQGLFMNNTLKDKLMCPRRLLLSRRIAFASTKSVWKLNCVLSSRELVSSFRS